MSDKTFTISTKSENFRTKLNFVDKNNVFVGYDFGQSWCEDFDWFIVDEPTYGDVEDRPKPDDSDLQGYVFDVEFFEKKMNIGGWSHKNVAIFRLFNREGDEKYLHLYNAHNGCYSHGFEFCDRELELEEGYI